MITLLNKIISVIINPLITIVLGLAVIYFLFMAFRFIREGDNSENRTQNANGMLWGLIGIAIMVSTYGIINFLLGVIGQ
ncbi:MAG: hypothetical protein WC757_04430 [Candidatus Paceibacterota bacterium]|jgi:hypothetical protein